MADISDLLNQVLLKLNDQANKLDEQGRDIKSVKQDVSTVKDVQQVHGEKLDKLDVKVNRLEDGQNRTNTVLKTVEEAIADTRREVDKIRRRPRQAD
jgi:chromosome segregation ATPase